MSTPPLPPAPAPLLPTDSSTDPSASPSPSPDRPTLLLLLSLLEDELCALQDHVAASRFERTGTVDVERGVGPGVGEEEREGEEGRKRRELEGQVEVIRGMLASLEGGQIVEEGQEEQEEEGGTGRAEGKRSTDGVRGAEGGSVVDPETVGVAEKIDTGGNETEQPSVVQIIDRTTTSSPPPSYRSSSSSPTSITTCSICLLPTHPVPNPFLCSLQPSSSTALPLGLYLGPRSDGHVVCLTCAGEYVRGKVEGESRAFPVQCPSCDYELTDDDAARILGADNLETWHYRKLVESEAAASSSFYCPNPQCSALLTRQDDAETRPESECPSCHRLLCVNCVSIYHPGYSCADFQALPPSHRANPDASVFDLARQMEWSRCPGCQALLELKHGCAHLVCRCGAEHCYICGANWSQKHPKDYGRCSSVPPCPLFVSEWKGPRPGHRDAQMQFVGTSTSNSTMGR